MYDFVCSGIGREGIIMGFNSTKFAKQQFEPREDDVEVPALAPWFDASETAEPPRHLWRVRGLTGPEFATMMNAATKTQNLGSIIEAIGSSEVKKEELKSLLGFGDDSPPDIMKRLEQIVLGSVEPKIDSSTAVKLANTFPIEFYQITNKITALTGLGMDLKK